MGYNISETSGSSAGTTANGLDGWVFNVSLADPSVTVVSGDFDVVNNGNNQGEATSGYTFGDPGSPFGTLTSNSSDGTFSFTLDRAALYASNSNQSITFSVVGSSGGNSDSDSVTINILICVARGTKIATPQGPRSVETLAAGDFVATRDSGAQQIQWIGSRRIDSMEMETDPSLRPVRIRKGALGHSVPARDLLVSPQHRILLTDWRAQMFFGQDEVLAPAKGLVNDRDILIDHSGEPVEYFHLLFEDHQVIWTEGAPTESFHPGPYTLREIDHGARRELFRLFPDLQRDPAGYGPAAHFALNVREATLVAVN